jgi:hypothetical protein
MKLTKSLAALAAITIGLSATTANAGEPFHPIWDPYYLAISIYDASVEYFAYLF